MKSLILALALLAGVSFGSNSSRSYQGAFASLEKSPDSVGVTMEYRFPITEMRGQLRPGSGEGLKQHLQYDDEAFICVYTYSWFLPAENQVVISAHRPLFGKNFSTSSGLLLETQVLREGKGDDCPAKLEYPGQDQYDRFIVRTVETGVVDAGTYHSSMFGEGRLLLTFSNLSSVPARASIEQKGGQFVISNLEIAHYPTYPASAWLKRTNSNQSDLHLGWTTLYGIR